MLRMSALVRAASTAAATTASPLPPKPLKVVVLTMVPNGGAMTEALRLLGYNPYTFEDSLRKGRVLTHPQEWMAVLRREKPFSFDILKIPEAPAKSASRRAEKLKAGGDMEDSSSSSTRKDQDAASVAPSPPRYYDALVGPPATIAFEAILKECPRSTRVILVEEPDKLAWEKDMDAWLRPLALRCEKSTRWWQDSRLHTMLLDMVDLRRALIDPAELRKGRVRPLATSSAAATAQNVPLAQQHATLRLSGALDLFEQHVKEVVPSERLLVFRVQDGWQPLCDFLQLPVPTSTASATAGSGSDSVTTPNAPLPFPVNASGHDALFFVDQSMQKANAVVLFILLSAAALGLLVLSSFRDELRRFYTDYRNYVYRDFEPLLAEEERRYEQGEESTLTLHKALVMTKKSTQRFGQAYENEGGAARSMSGVLHRFTGVPEQEEASPAVTAASPDSKSAQNC